MSLRRYSLEDCQRFMALVRAGYRPHFAPAPIRYAAGRWITIGGKEGEDGEKHGGSPVFVQDGKITKGHPSLTGKKLDALDQESDESHHQEMARSRGHAKATWAKKAKAEGVDAKHLHQLADELRQHSKAYADEHNAILAEARKALGEHSGAAKVLGASDRIEDASQVKGMDEVAEDMAERYPSYFSDSEHASDTLFGLLKEGNREPLDADAAHSQAFDVLMEHKAGKGDAFEEGGDTSFDFGGEPAAPEAMPSSQGNFFSPFKDATTKQRKMFDETPLPAEPKDRKDLPGQGMLPGTEVAPFVLTARNMQDEGQSRRVGSTDWNVAADGTVSVVHSITGRDYGKINLATGDLIPVRESDRPKLTAVYASIAAEAKREGVRQELQRLRDYPAKNVEQIKHLEQHEKRSASGMSEAIAMHGAKGLSKRAKRDADKIVKKAIFGKEHVTREDIVGETKKDNPDDPEVVRKKIAQLRSYAAMAGGKQAKRLLAEADDLERQL